MEMKLKMRIGRVTEMSGESGPAPSVTRMEYSTSRSRPRVTDKASDCGVLGQKSGKAEDTECRMTHRNCNVMHKIQLLSRFYACPPTLSASMPLGYAGTHLKAAF